MKKATVLLAALMCLSFVLAGCEKDPVLQDGTYTAKHESFDKYGWKEFVTVTVTENAVTEVVFDAENELDELKSQNAAYKEAMEQINQTYPEKFYGELQDQYLQLQKAEELKPIAGATLSSESFKTLLTALQPQMYEGVTDELIVGENQTQTDAE